MNDATQAVWNKWCYDLIDRWVKQWVKTELGPTIEKLFKRDKEIFDGTMDAVNEFRKQIDWLHESVTKLESENTRSITVFKQDAARYKDEHRRSGQTNN